MSAAITPVQAVMSILHTNGMALLWFLLWFLQKKYYTEEEIFFNANGIVVTQRKNIYALHRGRIYTKKE